MQHVLERVGIGDRGHGAVSGQAVEQQPRVRALGVGGGERGGEGESSFAHERGRDAQHPRALRPVEVEAAGLVARQQAEAGERHAGERLARAGRAPGVRPAIPGRAAGGGTTRRRRAYPPCPDARSPVASCALLRKAPTATTTNVPKAISATTSTLRPGRQDALRSPSAVDARGRRGARAREAVPHERERPAEQAEARAEEAARGRQRPACGRHDERCRQQEAGARGPYRPARSP